MAGGERAWALVKTMLFAATFMAFTLFYLPWTWAIRGRVADYSGAGALRYLGVLPVLAGLWITVRCALAHAWTGLGTPAPFDPPKKLVVTGFYRYVRNPMYFGAVLILLGETALFGSIVAGAEYAAAFAGCAMAFVMAYEEPALREKFGPEYEEYCRNVPRIVPRLTAWRRG